MRALFRSENLALAAVRDPGHSNILEVHGAELASVYYGRRVAGDFCDFIRVGPTRVLFGLFDVAGGLKETRPIVSAAQHTFRTAGTELFARRELNEADAMMELCLQLNQAILKVADGVRSCPAFAGSYDENLGIICYFNAGHTPGTHPGPQRSERTFRHRPPSRAFFPYDFGCTHGCSRSPVPLYFWRRVEFRRPNAKAKNLDCSG